MRKIAFLTAWIVAVAAAAAPVVRENASGSGNAALRYWAAFSELRDSALTVQQAKEISSILDGTIPYDDTKYQSLIQQNRLALAIMLRGSSLRTCDWGLDYDLGAETPVEYAREALILGRLNVLYTFHLRQGGQMEQLVPVLVAGLRFSQHVGNGGSLFATIIAKRLLTDHLRAVAEVRRLGPLTAEQDAQLQTALRELGPGLDWSSAARRDLELLRPYAQSPQAAEALDRIITTYVAALRDNSQKSSAEQALQMAPKDLANLIPDLGGVLQAKQELLYAIRQTRSLRQ